MSWNERVPKGVDHQPIMGSAYTPRKRSSLSDLRKEKTIDGKSLPEVFRQANQICKNFGINLSLNQEPINDLRCLIHIVARDKYGVAEAEDQENLERLHTRYLPTDDTESLPCSQEVLTHIVAQIESVNSEQEKHLVGVYLSHTLDLALSSS